MLKPLEPISAELLLPRFVSFFALSVEKSSGKIGHSILPKKMSPATALANPSVNPLRHFTRPSGSCAKRYGAWHCDASAASPMETQK